MLSLILSSILTFAPTSYNTQAETTAVVAQAWPKIRTEIHGKFVWVFYNDVLVAVVPLPVI